MKNRNSSNNQNQSEVVFYSYPESDVKNLNIDLSSANVVIIPGDCYSVESRGVDVDYIKSELKSDGLLSIFNERRFNFGALFRDKDDSFVQKILVTVPVNAKIEKLRIKLDMGKIAGREISLVCNTARLETKAGSMELSGINGGCIDFNCGMGIIDFIGTVTGKSNVKCGMGSVQLKIKGEGSDYSCDSKVGMGSVVFNGQQRDGFGRTDVEKERKNHFIVNCGLGNVDIVFI